MKKALLKLTISPQTFILATQTYSLEYVLVIIGIYIQDSPPDCTAILYKPIILKREKV
jgi:hypothetical protein